MTDEHKPGTRTVTPVAVGVLVRADGAVLLADRPAGKPYAGYWEFPGGKIESGESVERALERELAEELGVLVRAADPWTVLEYEYPHAYVRLHFWRIFEWRGTPRPVEGQQLLFLTPGAAPPAPLLPAAVPAVRWIQLPAVTGVSEQTAADAGQAQQWMDRALSRGLRQIVWYEPKLAGAALDAALRGCSARARAYGARMLVDSRTSPAAPDRGAGCYLSAAVLRSTDARPPSQWVGAGVRDRGDLEHAARLACDFALIEGPWQDGNDTAAEALASWQALARLGPETPLPLYVGLAPSADNLREARRHGAHGLAVRPLL